MKRHLICISETGKRSCKRKSMIPCPGKHGNWWFSLEFVFNIHAVMTKSPISILLSVGVVIAFTSVGGQASPAEITSPAISPAVVVNTELFDPAAATKAWLATVPRDQREKSD